MIKPMSKAEIAFCDDIAARLINGWYNPAQAYAMAISAVDARRAALLADAHVGTWCRSYSTGWICLCYDGITHGAETEYCERCHTRRPDEDKAKHDHHDGHACLSCKHEPTPYTESPCQECDFNSRWEAAP